MACTPVRVGAESRTRRAGRYMLRHVQAAWPGRGGSLCADKPQSRCCVCRTYRQARRWLSVPDGAFPHGKPHGRGVLVLLAAVTRCASLVAAPTGRGSSRLSSCPEPTPPIRRVLCGLAAPPLTWRNADQMRGLSDDSTPFGDLADHPVVAFVGRARPMRVFVARRAWKL